MNYEQSNFQTLLNGGKFCFQEARKPQVKDTSFLVPWILMENAAANDQGL